MSGATCGTRLDRFLQFSSVATAFTVFELTGTGMAIEYLAVVDRIVGPAVTDQLLAAYDQATASDGTSPELEDAIRRHVLSDPLLGPVARNIMKMWYVGVWYALPAAWSDAFGVRPGDSTFTVSPMAYTEGLLWPAIGASPPGAKAPGFGTWSGPPRIPRRQTAGPT